MARTRRQRLQDDDDSDMQQSDAEQAGEDLDMEVETPDGNDEETEITVDAEEEEEEPEEEEEEEEEAADDKDVEDEEEGKDVEEDEEEDDGEEGDEEDQADATPELDVLSSSPGKQEEEEEVEGEEEVEEDEEEEPRPHPRLKITLKLPPRDSANSSSVPTPDESARRGVSRDIDIESEDSDEGDLQSTRSTSVATTGTGGRPLTARQAVLANVVDSSHVSLLEPPNPRKKKPLTDIEIALKREETARKRRNLTEKKLEDEKAETINRLLKKQSRAKGKRNALSTADDRPSMPASGSNAALDADVEDTAEASAVPVPVIPTMYRWISSSRIITDHKPQENGSEPEPRSMILSFSVPIAALPQGTEGTENAMDVDRRREPLRNISSSGCDVPGCSEMRKYRLVKDFQKGACGMAHLKVLEAQSGSV